MHACAKRAAEECQTPVFSNQNQISRIRRRHILTNRHLQIGENSGKKIHTHVPFPHTHEYTSLVKIYSKMKEIHTFTNSC